MTIGEQVTDHRKENAMLIRHGDVVLVPVAEVPAGKTVRRKHGKLVLAEGEITGHAHVIEAPDVKLVTSEEAEELRLWLLVETAEPVALTHEEHATLLVPRSPRGR